MAALVLGLVLLVAAAGAGEADLAGFARREGLRDIQGFVAAVTAVRRDGRLPPRWITKGEAERAGWRPGQDLCAAARGHAIGGDRFGNREHRLPERRGRAWREADLDFACGRRGAKRLLWSSDGLVYVTTDHYESFEPVPP